MAMKTSSPPRAQAAAAGPTRLTANGRTSKVAAPAKMPAARGTTQRRQDETASVSPPVSVIGMSSCVGLPSVRTAGPWNGILVQIVNALCPSSVRGTLRGCPAGRNRLAGDEDGGMRMAL